MSETATTRPPTTFRGRADIENSLRGELDHSL